jgi:hypothetical protein
MVSNAIGRTTHAQQLSDAPGLVHHRCVSSELSKESLDSLFLDERRCYRRGMQKREGKRERREVQKRFTTSLR